MATVQQVYKRHTRPETQPSAFEVWSWFFMRISGVLLVFLLLGHMAIMHVFGGGVERINFDFVAARWSGLFWRTYDWFLLALALLHGGIGVRTVIQDYIRKDGWRVFLKALAYTAIFTFFAIGTLVIVTFEASQMPGGG
jgi:succinate dehydrogenase / fumarate reductase, membrane anchor subunit